MSLVCVEFLPFADTPPALQVLKCYSFSHSAYMFFSVVHIIAPGHERKKSR